MNTPEPPAPVSDPSRPKTRPTVDSIALRAEADQFIQEASDNYATLLDRQARILAVKDRMDEMQTIHAERAEQMLGTSDSKTIRRELLILIGGALFGTFLQGFTDAVTEPQVSGLKVAIYTFFGLAGAVLALWGLLKR